MTQKEEKEWSKMLPRFKEVCCNKICDNCELCKDKEDTAIMSCPWFFGYRVYGWPVKRVSDYSYNAMKLPDLRVEDPTDEIIKAWKK